MTSIVMDLTCGKGSPFIMLRELGRWVGTTIEVT